MLLCARVLQFCTVFWNPGIWCKLQAYLLPTPPTLENTKGKNKYRFSKECRNLKRKKKIPYLFWSILHHSYSKLQTSQVFVVWYIAVMLWKLNLITRASDAWMIKSCCRGSFQLNEFVLNLPNFKPVTWILMQVSEKKFLSYEE